MKKRTKKIEPGTAAKSRSVGWVLGFGFGLAALTQANVQVVQRDRVLALAKERGKYEIDKDLLTQRGTILSSDGRILAQNQDVFDFRLMYEDLPKSPAFFAELSMATGIAMDDLQRPALLGVERRSWRRHVTRDVRDRVQSIKQAWHADGISMKEIVRRAYPLGWAASGIVGLVRQEKSINGLERSLDAELGGRAGKVRGFVDRTGALLKIPDASLPERVDGLDVTLTLDSVIQFEASLAVKEAVEKNRATSGAVVVLDPKTGDILAMANYPTFDPEGNIEDNEDLNVAYRARFEPGSTFKAMTLAKALDLGKYRYDEGMQCGGAITVGKKVIKCSHGAHGSIDWEKAIAESCNVAASRWAASIGSEEMRTFIEQLGLLEKPEVGLPWEERGQHSTKDPAKSLQLANNGFGQAMNATPLALASAYASLANGGVRMKPRLIKKIGEKEVPVVEAGRVLSQEAADFVVQLMVSTIEKDFGTGKGLRVPGYQMAGKTGTAQKLQGGQMVGYVSNFLGVVPAYQPRALVLVMIDDPKAGDYYGGSVAGPVFTQMAKTIVRRFGIPPDSERSR